MAVNNASREGLLTYEEAADYLGFAEQTLRKWVSNDRIPYKKIGRNVRFRRSELDEWIESGDAAASQAS